MTLEKSRPEEGSLRSSDGTLLRFRRARPKESPRARLIVVHGFAEHAGRYAHLLEAASSRGIDAWALDLRGHGASEGARGFVRRFDEYLDDLAALVAHAGGDREGPPLFLLGHSMGGLVTVRYVVERRPSARGLVLSSPFLALGMPVPAPKRLVARLLSGVWPGLSLATGLDATGLSRDPEVARRYLEDPLVFHRATSRWFMETLAAQERALATASALEAPLLAMHGAADPIAHPDATRRLHAAASSKDKEHKVWEGLRHEPMNEPEGPQVIAHVLDWIVARA